jgi:leucyl-tRNA synthetase
MADSEMKKYGKDIQSFLKTLLNNYGELLAIEKFDEKNILDEAKNILENEFGSVEIISAEESQEAKAKNAFPVKPAILIE